MGLGGAPGEYEDYEWFDPHAGPSLGAEATPVALAALAHAGVWQPGQATRVLLVDLDNIRVTPGQLRTRVLLAVALARQADVAVFAGQHGSVQRARAALQEYGETAIEVGAARNAADAVLLDAAAACEDEEIQFVVFSNDRAFARLAMRGPLTVVSPGAAALSDQLSRAAEQVIDLRLLESVTGAD